MKVTQLDARVFSRYDWGHRLRAWSYALGVTTRQRLLSAAHPGPRPFPSQARETLRELLLVGDLAGPGVGQLVAPAPRRYVGLGDGHFAVLGGSPESYNETSSLIRLMRSSTTPGDGPGIGLDLWLDHRRTPDLGADWLERQLPDWLDALPGDPGGELFVYDAERDAPHHEGRWRTLRRKDDGLLLLRGRNAAGDTLHFWAECSAGIPALAHRLHPEGACLVRYALDKVHGNPVVGRLRQTDVRTVEIQLPSWIPRAEFRLLTALSESRPQSSREPWVVGSDLARVAWVLLERRLGIEWEGPDR